MISTWFLKLRSWHRCDHRSLLLSTHHSLQLLWGPSWGSLENSNLDFCSPARLMWILKTDKLQKSCGLGSIPKKCPGGLLQICVVCVYEMLVTGLILLAQLQYLLGTLGWGNLTNWKSRSKCKRILSIALLREEFQETFPFARLIEKFFEIFTKASLFCTREVSQCGKEEKYLCWVCHTASEHDPFLLFKVWLSYYLAFHQVLNENKSSKAGRQSNYLDHTNTLSDGEGCTCWGWRTWFPACPCLMWMGWVILGKSFHTLEFSSSTK